MMSSTTFPKIETLSFGPLISTSKGSKQIPILQNKTKALTWQPDEFWDIPFEPGNFADKESNRVSICFTPQEQVENCLKIFDLWCIKTLANQSKELLGQQISEEQVKARYVSPLKTSEKGYTTLRCKMNRAGPHAVQCWTQGREQRLPPDCWQKCKVKPMLYFKSIYIMGKDLGPIIECTHAMIEESEIECPF